MWCKLWPGRAMAAVGKSVLLWVRSETRAPSSRGYSQFCTVQLWLDYAVGSKWMWIWVRLSSQYSLGTRQLNKDHVWNTVSRHEFRRRKREMRRGSLLLGMVALDDVSLVPHPHPRLNTQTHAIPYTGVPELSLRGLHQETFFLSFFDVEEWT